MALPDFTMRELLEAGVHFGHQTRRWNPKMSKYIFGERSNVHILDLQQTVPLLHQALLAISDTASNGGRVLAISSLGDDIEESLDNVYKRIEKIHFDEMYYRKDIGFDLVPK